jgi:rubrerythrin
MADAFEKFKSSINRGITTISMKTASSLEKTKLKTHMDSLKTENQRLIVEVGELAYKKWYNGDPDCAQLEQLCIQIRTNQQTIQDLTAELNSIDERDNQILGTKTEKVAAPSIVCPNCGTGYESPVKFCRSCGFKMPE